MTSRSVERDADREVDDVLAEAGEGPDAFEVDVSGLAVVVIEDRRDPADKHRRYLQGALSYPQF